MDYVDENKMRFDRVARQPHYKWRHQDLTRQFISGFQMLLSGNKVLDLGCGAGSDALRLKRYDLHVQGLDISEVMLEVAKEQVKGVDFILGDLRQLPFAEGQFDGVWANASFIYLKKPDLHQAAEEVYRVLKPGAVFFSSFKLGKGEEVVDGIYHYLYENEEIRQLYTELLFKIFDVSITGDYISLYAVK